MRGNSDPTGALLLGFGAGLWSFFKGFRVMREYKVLADTPRIPIRSVPMGFVHIRGKAEGTQVLSSPVSHTPCCFYRVEVDEWRSQGKGHNWVRTCVDYNGYQFYLADDTGKVLIDAHAAEYDLPAASTREVSSHSQSGAADADLLHYVQYAQTHSMTDRVSQFVDKRLAKAAPSGDPAVQAKREALRDIFAGISSVQRGGKPPIEAMERLMNASGPLSDPEKEQRRQMMLDRLHMAAQANQSGLLAALLPEQRPAEGRFRLREYLVLPDQEYLIDGTCVECSEPAASADRSMIDRTMIAKGTNEPTFLISAKSDVEVHRAFRKRALLMILGGAALTLACAAGLLLHFGLW
jgi:hypothetical protein